MPCYTNTREDHPIIPSVKDVDVLELLQVLSDRLENVEDRLDDLEDDLYFDVAQDPSQTPSDVPFEGTKLEISMDSDLIPNFSDGSRNNIIFEMVQSMISDLDRQIAESEGF